MASAQAAAADPLEQAIQQRAGCSLGALIYVRAHKNLFVGQIQASTDKT